jgi:cobalamin biosynthesis protein CobT
VAKNNMSMSEAAFKSKIVSILSDNRYDRFVSGRRSGKVDTKKLFRINYSDRVFKKQEARKNKDYAVSLLIDCSGSMRNNDSSGKTRIQLAAECAEKLYHALENAGANIEVRGFNTFPGYAFKRFGEKKLLPKIVEKRVLNEVFKPVKFNYDNETHLLTPEWDPAFDENKRWEGATQGNCDGEAVAFARERLLKEKGEKILFVLSDGRPSFDMGMDYFSYHNPKKKYEDYSLKSEVEQCIKQGIKVYGIGIQTDRVTEYYPAENVDVVRNLDQLYPVVVNRLQKLIKRG